MMCAGYREIPEIKLRRELEFGPIDNWFDPTPVLSAMMLQGGFGGFIFTFAEGTGLALSVPFGVVVPILPEGRSHMVEGMSETVLSARGASRGR